MSGPSSCGSTCINGYYPNNSVWQCLRCDSSCKECTAGDVNSCTNCNPPNYLQPTLSTLNCLTTCPDGYYPNDTSRDCVLCDNSCFTCSANGSKNCLSCKINTYLQDITGTSSCLTTCSEGKYPDTITLKCLSCHDSCKTCSAGDVNSCKSCNSPNYLQSTLSASACLTTCPDGYYPDTISRDCLACDTTCLTCSSSGSTYCLTCKKNSYLKSLPAPSSCISTCLDGKYLDSVSSECLLCDRSCKTCAAGDANSCIGCNSPNYLQSMFNASACLTTCPDGNYPDTISRNCLLCYNTCLTCSSNGSSACLTCKNNIFLQNNQEPFSYYLFKGECLTKCPSKSYADNQTFTCKFCHYSCHECLDQYENNCTSCNNETRILKSNTLSIYNDKNLSTVGSCECIHKYYDMVDNEYCLCKIFLIIKIE